MKIYLERMIESWFLAFASVTDHYFSISVLKKKQWLKQLQARLLIESLQQAIYLYLQRAFAKNIITLIKQKNTKKVTHRSLMLPTCKPRLQHPLQWSLHSNNVDLTVKE